jgi:hypothetical protein
MTDRVALRCDRGVADDPLFERAAFRSALSWPRSFWVRYSSPVSNVVSDLEMSVLLAVMDKTDFFC